MAKLDISQYFAEFSPTPQQLRRLTVLVNHYHASYGSTSRNPTLEAALVLAPGNLSRLSQAAYDLLRRCQSRKWQFRVRLDERPDPFSRQTYGELFNLLHSLGFIAEASPCAKLWGSKKVEDLRSLLSSRGIPSGGRKEELVDRVAETLTPAELISLVDGVLLYVTTEEGDRALSAIRELSFAVTTAFMAAVAGTSEQYESQQEPQELPPGVLYDDGEVQISQSDVDEAEARLEQVLSSIDLRGKRVTLTTEAIQGLLRSIEARGDGWLTISVADQPDDHFVQASYMDGDPEHQWTCEARGDADALAALGFALSEDGLLPMRRISSNEIEGLLVATLRTVFGVNPGDDVYLNSEIAS